MNHWYDEAIFYHIYPLGLCAAPQQNDFNAPITPRLDALHPWVDHIADMGCNALYLGPLFESSTHGYDTANYFVVDRRLGDDDTLKALIYHCHQRGVRVVLDGVFNHVGRDFWAFKDVQQYGQASGYCDWFADLHFGTYNQRGDAFTYANWNGCDELVKLNLHNPAVRQHLLLAVDRWMDVFDIDGIRLDAADCVDLAFQQELAAHCHARRADFWLMGEVIHGDYRQWANPVTLDSVTNYECYKGLHSSLNDRNYFEIAWSLNRQFGEDGLYRHFNLYSFVDNHDVNRVASTITHTAHLFPLYALLFTMPGLPSIYYGSEFGVQGRKNGSDAPLRPALDLTGLINTAPQAGLHVAIKHLIGLRWQLACLRHGNYQAVLTAHEQFAFMREWQGQSVLVVLNAAHDVQPLTLTLPQGGINGQWVDVLNDHQPFEMVNSQMTLTLPACWARVLTPA